MSRKEDFDSFQKRFNSSGKVGKNDFSIDGKSFDYRDPKNANTYSSSRKADNRYGNFDGGNSNAYEYTNPLYDYSYGIVRDAAKELNIGNVNSKGEVKQLLKQIQGGSKSKAEDFKDDFIDKKVAPRPNSNTEVEIPTGATSGDATAGDNSIASPISQQNGISVTGDRNEVDQDNSIDQKQAGSFLEKYKLSLKGGKGLNLNK